MIHIEIFFIKELQTADVCAAETKLNDVVSKFSVNNQVAVNQMLGEVKSLQVNAYKEAASDVINGQTALVSQFQSVDPNGYAAFNSLVASADASQTCAQRVASMTAYANSLNAQGKLVANKVNCFIKQGAKSKLTRAMGQWVLNNMDTITKLKTEESANFNELMNLVRKL